MKNIIVINFIGVHIYTTWRCRSHDFTGKTDDGKIATFLCAALSVKSKLQ